MRFHSGSPSATLIRKTSLSGGKRASQVAPKMFPDCGQPRQSYRLSSHALKFTFEGRPHVEIAREQHLVNWSVVDQQDSKQSTR